MTNFGNIGKLGVPNSKLSLYNLECNLVRDTDTFQYLPVEPTEPAAMLESCFYVSWFSLHSPISIPLRQESTSKRSGRLPVSYYRSLRFGKLRISAKFKFIYLLFLPRSDLSSVIRSMTAGLRKFILLWCNTLYFIHLPRLTRVDVFALHWVTTAPLLHHVHHRVVVHHYACVKSVVC